MKIDKSSLKSKITNNRNLNVTFPKDVNESQMPLDGEKEEKICDNYELLRALCVGILYKLVLSDV